MVVDTPQDAAWQEIQSVGAFSGVLVVVNEIMHQLGLESPIVMIAVNVIVMIANIIWQYVDNEGFEMPTVPKQFSRLGVNSTMFFVGVGLYGIILAYYGISPDSDFAKNLEIMSKDVSSWIKPLLVYISTVVVYAATRIIANILLLFPAVIPRYV